MRTPALLVTASFIAIYVLASPARAATITRGPYLQLQTPDSIHVVWLTTTSVTSELEWGLTTAYGNNEQSTGPATRHGIAITVLQPDAL